MSEEMHQAIERDRKARTLPAIAGTMERSIADHERACLVLIEHEQRKIAPDNHIIATLADSVRLGREYADSQRCKLQQPDPRLPELIAAAEAAVPYVEGAYECAFPNESDNAEVLATLRAALAAFREVQR